jgi:hypothetical protein
MIHSFWGFYSHAPIGSHECVVLKYLFMIFDASSLGMSSEPGHRSRHSSVPGNATSIPRVATESRKHVARSEETSDGTLETNELNETSDRNGNDDGVSVRLWTLSVATPASDLVGVDGVVE